MKTICPAWESVLIPAGKLSVRYGCKEPIIRELEISTPFFIGKYPVTQEQWERASERPNPSQFKRGGKFPVDSVTWHEAQEFCCEMSRIGQRSFRLPTEAEWEYACVGGETVVEDREKLAWFDGGEDLGKFGWFCENSGMRPHPVGEKLPNAWGLYDMLGNVWEWCQDRACDSQSDTRVVRGGSWISVPENCRAACRNGAHPERRLDDFGFRLVCV